MAGQHAGNALQSKVTSRMAVTIVVGFEVIEIEHDQSNAGLIAMSLLQRSCQQQIKAAAVIKLRESVGIGHIAQGTFSQE